MRLFLGSFATINDLETIKEHFPMLTARWTPKANIHLTYLFLGESYDPATVIQKLQGIHYLEKSIQLSGLGTFGKPPRILYAKAEDKALLDLHNEIVTRLDLKPDKPFIPHITLARLKKVESMARFKNALKEYEAKVLGELQVELQLIQSELTPQGARYKTLFRFPPRSRH